jgi:hypothetical protein
VIRVSVADSNFNPLNSNRSFVGYSFYSYRNDTYQSWNVPVLDSVLVRGPAKKISSFGRDVPSLYSLTQSNKKVCHFLPFINH